MYINTCLKHTHTHTYTHTHTLVLEHIHLSDIHKIVHTSLYTSTTCEWKTY